MTPRYVYVVIYGCYEEREVTGIYDSPEAAMADNPVPVRPLRRLERDGGWKLNPYAECEWSNGLDWNDRASITRFELKTLPSEVTP